MAKNEEKVKVNPLPFWSILATFSTFLKWSKKVKVNPLPFWSILATFSTFLKWSKKASKTLKNDSKQF